MRPYFRPTVRINITKIYVARDYIYNPEHIDEMESIAYLWRDGKINISNGRIRRSQMVADDFQPILNSPTILQCRELEMGNANFSFKDYKVLYAVKFIEIFNYNCEINPNYWPQFLEQPGVKPVVTLHYMRRECVANVVDCLSKAFYSDVLPNSFIVVFSYVDKPLAEFRETNNTFDEILELKKGFPTKYQYEGLDDHNCYMLERSSI